MRFLIGVSAVLLLSVPALAQGLEVFPGQTITATIEQGGELGIIRMHLVTGETLSLKMSVAKGSGLYPEIALYNPAGIYTPLPVTVGKKISASVPITQTGVWYLAIWGQSGTTGGFTLATKLKTAKPAPHTFNAGLETFSADLRKGTVLKCSAKAADAGFELGIDSVDSPGGQDVIDGATKSESGGSVSFSTLAVPYTGTYTFRFVARSGVNSVTTAKLSAKVPKVAVAKPLPDELYETMVVKEAGDPTTVMAEVDGPSVVLAVLLPNYQGPGTILAPDGDRQCQVTGPDGWYVLRVTLQSGRITDHCFWVHGAFPTAPTNIQVDSDSVSWDSPDSDGLFHVGVWSEVSDDDLFGHLLSAVHRTSNLPSGLVAPGWPYTVEVTGLSQGFKMSSTEWTQYGSMTNWKGAATIGDLVALTLDTSTGDFTYTPVEPAGAPVPGAIEPAGEYGAFAFRVQGSSPTQYVLGQPGVMAAGTLPGGAYCVVPNTGGDYVPAQIASSYNFISCRLSGPDPETAWGNFALYAAGSWAIWLGADRQLLASGDWDQSGGVVHLKVGADRLANVTFGQSGSGRRIAVFDFPGTVGGRGLGIGIEQARLSGSQYDGAYTGLATDMADPDPGTVELIGGVLRLTDGAEVSLKIDTPYDGMATGGSPTEGGILMTAPGCPLVIGSWGEGDDAIGIYFRR